MSDRRSIAGPVIVGVLAILTLFVFAVLMVKTS